MAKHFKWRIDDIIMGNNFVYHITDITLLSDGHAYKVECVSKPPNVVALNPDCYYSGAEMERLFQKRHNFNYNKLWNNLNAKI